MSVRTKITRRYRKKCLKMGLNILEEKFVFSSKEMKENHYARKDNGYHIYGDYKGWKISAAEKDKLQAWKLMLWCIDDPEFEECNEELNDSSKGHMLVL